MPTDEELRFVMRVDADMSRAKSEIIGVGKMVSAEARRMEEAWSNLGKQSGHGFVQRDLIEGMTAASKTQSALFEAAKQASAEAKNAADAWAQLGKESGSGNVKIDMIRALSEAAKPQNELLEIQKHVTKELESQEKLLLRIKTEMDPDNLKKRVALEKQISDAKKEQAKAEYAEQKRQGIIPSGFDIKKLFGSLKDSGFGDTFKGLLNKDSGFDLRSLFSGPGGKIPTVQPAGKGPPSLPGGAGAGAGEAAGEGVAMEGAAGAAGIVGLALAPLAIAAIATKKALALVGSGLKELQGDLGPLGLFFNAIPLFGDTLKGITSSLVSMAQKASPALFQQWQVALDDVQGVIGHTFLPVFNMMKDAVRFFGDVLATVLPSTQEMADMMDELKENFNSLKNEIKELIIQNPEIKGLFTGAIQFFIDSANNIISVVTLLAKSLKALLWPFTAILAVMGLKPVEWKSSVGASARQAEISSTDEYQRKLQLAFYSQTAGLSGNSPERQTADNTAGILRWLQNSRAPFLGGTRDEAMQQGQAAGGAVGGLIGPLGGAVGPAAGGAIADVIQDIFNRAIQGLGGG